MSNSDTFGTEDLGKHTKLSELARHRNWVRAENEEILKHLWGKSENGRRREREREGEGDIEGENEKSMPLNLLKMKPSL